MLSFFKNKKVRDDVISYHDRVSLHKNIINLITHFENNDILKKGCGSIYIYTLFDSIEDYIMLNHELLTTHNIELLNKVIPSNRNKSIRLLDFLKYKDSDYIINNYEKYVITLLNQILRLLEAYNNSIDYKILSYKNFNSKKLYQYIVNMMLIFQHIKRVC